VPRRRRKAKRPEGRPPAGPAPGEGGGRPAQEKKPKKQKKPKSAGRSLVETVIFVAVAVVVVRWTILEAFKIPSGSMEPTLLGHPYHGDRVLVWKPSLYFGDPERWSVFVFVKHPDPMRPETKDVNYIKRVVGLPGERLIIAGGDLFVDSPGAARPEIARKPAAVQEAVWHAVYEGDLDRPWGPRARWEFETEQGDLFRHEPGRRAIVGRADGRAWARFSFNQYEDDGGLVTNLYVRRLRLRLVCRCGHRFRASVRTSRTRLRCPACEEEIPRAALDDRLRELKGKARQPLAREEEVPVADLRVSFDVTASRSQGFCLAELAVDEDRFRARVPLGGGEAEVAGAHGVSACAEVPAFEPGRARRVAFAHVDQALVLSIDGRDVVRAEYDLDWRERAGRPERNSARIGLEGAELAFRDLLIERDVHYLARGSSRYVRRERSLLGPDPHRPLLEFYSAEGRAWSRVPLGSRPNEPPTIGAGDAVRTARLGRGEEKQFFMMGDNSPSSYDSRMWGPIGEGDLVGEAFFAFWPPHRMGWLH
jgi:signal peptidase I